jgi:CheY-like chemotaxis protein
MATGPRDLSGGVSGEMPSPRWRVLLATGSPMDRTLAGALLRKHGHQVDVASTGLEAVRQAAQQSWDVVILDRWLPEMDSVAVARMVREQQGTDRPRLPILLMVSDDDASESELSAGIDAVVHKPLKMDEIVRCLVHLQCRVAEVAMGGVPHGQRLAIDWGEALQAVGGRRELLIELIEMFFEEYPPTLEAARAAVEQGDAKGLQFAAHKLKGCLRYFGRSAAADHALGLETMGRKGELAGARTEFDRLTAEIERLLPDLRAGPG